MKKILILIYSLSITTIYTQTKSNSIIQNAVNNTAVVSPNTAALFRYVETPVSLYTGVPDITIPLYTIKEGDIEVPISISYHSGGIKVNDEASSVGLGWSLNTGGMVSHVMAGANDFSAYGYYNIYPKNATGYVGSVSGCPTPTWNNSTAVSSYYSNTFRMLVNDLQGSLYPEYDFQPDLFLINLPGKSYKAYLDMTKTTKTSYPKFAIEGQANINFKIIPNIGFQPNAFGDYNFQITDEKGLNYYFDQREVTRSNYTKPATGISDLLSKIEDTKGKSVKFFYSNFSLSGIWRLAGSRSTRVNFTLTQGIPSGSGTGPGYFNNNLGANYYNKQRIDENYIQKIEFTNGKVEFTWEDREDINKSKKLTSVKIYNNYKLIKQYDFNYDYLIANDNLNTEKIASWLVAPNNKVLTHRLRLLSLTESLTNERYSFDYNTAYNLPNKLSFAVDFWGYYNGQNNDDTFIPSPDKFVKGTNPFTLTSFNQDPTGYWYQLPAYQIPSPTTPIFEEETTMLYTYKADGKKYLSDRRASLSALAGILTGINYPTGGRTEFEYELNTFSNYPIQSLMDNISSSPEKDYSLGGGLRIKNIKTTEKPGAVPLIKNYIYEELNNNGTKITSNGNLAEFPKFYEIENRCYSSKNDLAGGSIVSNPGCSIQYLPSTYAEYPFRISVYEGTPAQGVSTLTQKGAVGYSKVIEQVNGKGKTENYFINNVSGSCLTMMPRGKNYGIGNGDITKQKYYDENNSLIKEVGYNYKFNSQDNLNTYFISGAILEPVTTFVDHNFTTNAYPTFGGLIHTYTISLYKSLLESTVSKEYFPAGSDNYMETKLFTTYNNRYLPKTEKTTFPDTSINETSYNYAEEKGNQLMISKNMVEIPMETIVTETKNGLTKTLSKIETIYPTSLPDVQIGDFILPKSVKSSDLNDNTSSTEVTLDKYDAKGNLIQYTTKDGSPVSIIWGYNFSLPIAKIEGAKYDDVSTYIQNIITLSNEDAENPVKEEMLLVALDNLRKNNNFGNYQVTTYTHDPLIGVTSVTPSSGVREYYKYDITNRLEKIVDVNNKIIKEFKYRYGNSSPIANTNDEKSGVFTRTNCTGNTVGGSYTYIVPSGTYTSDVSKLAANLMAIEDINANGQNMANQNGACIPIVSCDFTFSPALGNPSYIYNSTTTVNNTVNFYVSFSGYGIWQSWGGGLTFGNVGASCIPSVNREIIYTEPSFNRKWRIFIDTSGNCNATLISGTVDPSSQNSINFYFQYQK